MYVLTELRHRNITTIWTMAAVVSLLVMVLCVGLVTSSVDDAQTGDRDTSAQNYSVEFILIYQMNLTCTDFLKDALLRELKNKFVNTLSDRWPGLCVDACTNLVAAGVCDAKKIVVSATLTKLGDKITKKDASITLSPDEIIKITAIESDDLNDKTFRNFGQSMLQKDLTVVVMKASCDEAVDTSGCDKLVPLTNLVCGFLHWYCVYLRRLGFDWIPFYKKNCCTPN